MSKRAPASATPRPPLDRAFYAIVAAALLIKLAVALQLAQHPLLQDYGTLDTSFYVEAAKRVAAGDLLFGDRAFYASPLYLYFLSAVFALAGPSLLAARIVQALLGALGVALAMHTARRWFGRPAALLTGALLALTGIVTFFEIVILQSALDPFLMALGGWLIARAARLDTPRAWALAGAGLGLHALNRPNLLLAIAAAAAFAAFLAWRSRRSLLPAAALLLGAALAIAPVTLRNLAVSGQPILISSHGGLNFYIGNNPQADGAYRPIDGITPSIEGQAADARRLVSSALTRDASDSDVSAYFFAQSWDWILAHPADALRLTARKLLFLLNATSPSLNYSYSFYSREESTLLSVLFLGPWLLVPLGLTGFLLILRSTRPPGVPIWAVVTLVYAASVVAFFVTDRYQLPLLVPLAIAAAAALASLWNARQSPVRLALPLCVLAVLLGVSNYNLGLDNARSEERLRLALALIGEGDSTLGEATLARSLAAHPNPASLHYQAARAYAIRRDFPPAERHLRQALQLQPALAEAHFLLGRILLDLQRPADAIPSLQRAADAPALRDAASLELVKAFAASDRLADASTLLAQLQPPPGAPADTLLALGALSLELRQPAAAVRLLQAASAAKPSDPAILEQLAVAHGLAGDPVAALATLEKALALAPNSPSLHLNLAVTNAQSGRFDDARREALEALRLRPDYPQALALLRRLDAR